MLGMSLLPRSLFAWMGWVRLAGAGNIILLSLLCQYIQVPSSNKCIFADLAKNNHPSTRNMSPAQHTGILEIAPFFDINRALIALRNRMMVPGDRPDRHSFFLA